MTNNNEGRPDWAGSGLPVRQHEQEVHDDDGLTYVMPPLRPEKRDRYFPWFVVGLFFWPLLLVAADYYFKDQRAYDAAMHEYRMGGDPIWYWEGMASSPVNGGAGASSTKKRSAVGVVVLVVLLVLVVLAVAIPLLIGLLAGGAGGMGGGDWATIEELGSGTVILLPCLR